MSLELKAVQVRLPEEAFDTLRQVAEVNDQDLGEAARVILTEALLGKGHAVKILAERLSRATKCDKVR
jgi:hypothetical protein